MQRRRRPNRAALCISALVLCAPPALRLVEHFRLLHSASDAPPDSPDAYQRRIDSLTSEAVSLRESLRQCQAELAELAGQSFLARDDSSFVPRYRAAWADVLPFVDPSPGRGAFWIFLPGVVTVNNQAAVVFEQSLAGRVVEFPVGAQVVRVQTLLDPLFRVRFRSEEVEGILWGTGERDTDGHAMLEARHLSPVAALPAGAPVFTRGHDGVYPPGILIGRVIPEEGSSSPHPSVRAAAQPERALRVVIVQDQAPQALATSDERQSGRGTR